MLYYVRYKTHISNCDMPLVCDLPTHIIGLPRVKPYGAEYDAQQYGTQYSFQYGAQYSTLYMATQEYGNQEITSANMVTT